MAIDCVTRLYPKRETTMTTRAIAIILALVSLPALAQAPNRSALLQTLSRGAEFTSQNERYQLLPEVQAVQRVARDASPQQAVVRAGATAGDLIETKAHFVIFRTTAQSTTHIQQSPDATLYPAAFNPRTGGIGILPGTVIVKPKDMGSAAAIANDHGLELVRAFAHLHIAFYRVKPGQDILAAVATLRTDARVQSAEIEVLEHLRVPR
jgi:hypothetical protein